MTDEITVWMCPECGYWRKDQTTGVHTATDPDNPHGRMLAHDLVATTFVREDVVEERVGTAIEIWEDR